MRGRGSQTEQWANNVKSRIGELYQRCVRLVEEGRRDAVLRVSLAGVPGLSERTCSLVTSIFTGERDMVDLTTDDDHVSMTRAVVNVDDFCAYFSKEKVLVKLETAPPPLEVPTSYQCQI